MSFYKRDKIMLIMFLSISVTIITVNGAGNNEAGPSENISATPAKDYEGYSYCWRDMKKYLKKDNPDAIDFVRTAITDWVDDDIFFIPYIADYYYSFKDYLNAEDILYPDDYCLIFENQPTTPQPVAQQKKSDKNAPKTEVKNQNVSKTEVKNQNVSKTEVKSKCQMALREFGVTNQEALLYGFYGTKVFVIDLATIADSPILRALTAIQLQEKDYKGNYLKYMAENVQLRGDYLTPLEYCQDYDAMLKEEHMKTSQNK